MGFSWDFHGIFMGFSWDFHGIFMGFVGFGENKMKMPSLAHATDASGRPGRMHHPCNFKRSQRPFWRTKDPLKFAELGDLVDLVENSFWR